MKTITTIIWLLTLTCLDASANPTTDSYEFDWTAQIGSSQYNTSIHYSGGVTVNGVFTPTGLIDYSFGTDNGPITQPFFEFLTDTPYGPSFDIQGTIQPIPYPGNGFAPGFQEFAGPSLNIFFQGQTETIIIPGVHTSITGTWSETVFTTPDATNSALLLATALGALGLFHAFRRRRLAQT